MTMTSRRSKYLRGLCRYFGMIVRDLGRAKVAGADLHRPGRVRVTEIDSKNNFESATLTGASPALVGME